jgi:hypothetical protein
MLFLFMACLRILLAVSFDMLVRPGRRIGLCGDAPRAPTQRPGFGGSGRSFGPAPRNPGYKAQNPGGVGEPQFTFRFPERSAQQVSLDSANR